MAGPPNLHYLEAEVAAWPLASVESFERALDTLDRTDTGVLSRETERLSERLMEYLRPRARGLSIEILSQLRDAIWFAPARSTPGRRKQHISLVEFAISLVERRLAFSGDQVVLRPDGPLPLEQLAESWRWQSLLLPVDFLVAAHAAAARTEPVSDVVSLGAPYLERFFEEEGIAQTHLHLGAAMPFEWIWTSLMSSIGSAPPPVQALETGTSTVFGSGKRFLDWLVTAALSRTTLASFLWHREVGHAVQFGDHLKRVVRRERDADIHLTALNALCCGREPAPHARTLAVLRRLLTSPPRKESGDLREDVRRLDPLSAWVGPAPGPLPETRLLTRAMRYLLESGDGTFARHFWQYVRLRNCTYRHLVLEPGTAGLDWFSRHFRRISAIRGKNITERTLMSSALALESRGPPLQSLEVRVSPYSRWFEVRDLARHIAEAPAPPTVNPERGVLIHFVKDKVPRDPRQFVYADPRHRAHGCRFGPYYYQRLKEAFAIEAALNNHPESLVILRGLDVCNLELAVPTWVFIPLLRRLRRHSERIARALAPFGRVPPFRLTLHAGEDFRRLSEGLRLVHEPIEFGVLTTSDRMGHAVALGVDPDEWAAAIPAVWQPTEERLDDLLWELARYRRAEIPTDASRLEFVHGEINRLGTRIYGAETSTDDLLRARELRHAPDVLEGLGYPFLRNRQLAVQWGRPGLLLWQYLTDFATFERGQRPEEVPTHPSEITMLRSAQRFLRQLFSRLGITVEANPSSNMLIGDLPLDRLPIFRLQPLPGQQAAEGGPVLVALGDDDPITFASCLPDEFTHLYFALIRKGVAVQAAHEWLDQLRRNGLRARFTLPQSVAG